MPLIDGPDTPSFPSSHSLQAHLISGVLSSLSAAPRRRLPPAPPPAARPRTRSGGARSACQSRRRQSRDRRRPLPHGQPGRASVAALVCLADLLALPARRPFQQLVAARARTSWQTALAFGDALHGRNRCPVTSPSNTSAQVDVDDQIIVNFHAEARRDRMRRCGEDRHRAEPPRTLRRDGADTFVAATSETRGFFRDRRHPPRRRRRSTELQEELKKDRLVTSLVERNAPITCRPTTTRCWRSNGRSPSWAPPSLGPLPRPPARRSSPLSIRACAARTAASTTIWAASSRWSTASRSRLAAFPDSTSTASTGMATARCWPAPLRPCPATTGRRLGRSARLEHQPAAGEVLRAPTRGPNAADAAIAITHAVPLDRTREGHQCELARGDGRRPAWRS